jgi:hypothetical protein
MNNFRSYVENKILPFVETPGQYIGGEWNSVKKEDSSIDVTFALAFPDTYAIGMSHQGMQILYGLLNERKDTACERVFAPWYDMEAALRKHDIPLYSLESFRPLGSSTLSVFRFNMRCHIQMCLICWILQRYRSKGRKGQKKTL